MKRFVPEMKFNLLSFGLLLLFTLADVPVQAADPYVLPQGAGTKTGAFSVKPGGNGTAAGLWAKGSVRAEHCTFHDNDINLDLDEATARVELIRCIVSGSRTRNGTPSTVEPGGTLTLTQTAVWGEGKSGDDPRFASGRSGWDGTGPGMDSRRYGKARGYHSVAAVTGR
jgi:hypothetical protein